MVFLIFNFLGLELNKAFLQFISFVDRYKEEQGTDGEDAFPLYVPAEMRRNMAAIFRHPSYSTMISELLQSIT